MAGQQQILKEYLLALGFKVNESETKKFDKTVNKFDVSLGDLGKKALGVAVAAQAMVAVFANSMEKLYYASKRSETTAGNLQAIAYGGSQIGLSAESMKASVEAMARALRASPGLQGLLESLGVPVEGRGKDDVLIDMVKALKGMPFYQAQQYASLFGIDADTLFMLQAGVAELEKARDLRKQMAAEVGLNEDDAAKAGKEYAQSLREITERLMILRNTLAVALLPLFKQASDYVADLLKGATKTIGDANAGKFGGWAGVADRARKVFIDPLFRPWGSGNTRASTQQNGPGAANGAGVGGSDPAALFKRLEGQYGLPEGLLDKMWAKESGRGKNMTSRAGAQGHFQFMPDTAKQMGLDDPNDLVKSAGAAASYMKQLLARYNGDIQKALAAYNWGMGNVDKKGLANAPWETQDYVATLSGRPIQIQQTNQFNIQNPDPQAVSRAVQRDLGTANSNLARTYSGVPR